MQSAAPSSRSRNRTASSTSGAPGTSSAPSSACRPPAAPAGRAGARAPPGGRRPVASRTTSASRASPASRRATASGDAPFWGPKTWAAPRGPWNGLSTSHATWIATSSRRGSRPRQVERRDAGHVGAPALQLRAVRVEGADAERPGQPQAAVGGGAAAEAHHDPAGVQVEGGADELPGAPRAGRAPGRARPAPAARSPTPAPARPPRRRPAARRAPPRPAGPGGRPPTRRGGGRRPRRPARRGCPRRRRPPARRGSRRPAITSRTPAAIARAASAAASAPLKGAGATTTAVIPLRSQASSFRKPRRRRCHSRSSGAPSRRSERWTASSPTGTRNGPVAGLRRRDDRRRDLLRRGRVALAPRGEALAQAREQRLVGALARAAPAPWGGWRAGSPCRPSRARAS